MGDYALQAMDKLGKDSKFGQMFKKDVKDNTISQETNVNYLVTKVALGEEDAGFAQVSDATRSLHKELSTLPSMMNTI